MISDNIGNTYTTHSQTANNIISIPDNVNVDMYTGSLNMDIPLYELIVKKISVPVKITYNLNDVKPNLYPGIVGLGWRLQAGGAIGMRNVLCGS